MVIFHSAVVTHAENPKDFTYMHTQIKLTNDVNKVACYKTHKNQVQVYTLTIKNTKRKLNDPIYNSIKKNAIVRNKSN
jgi:hypothetical protein